MTAFETLLANHANYIYDHVYKVNTLTDHEAFLASSELIPNGVLLIVSYTGGVPTYKIGIATATYAELPNLLQIDLKDWTVCDPADSNSPKVITDVDVAITQSLVTSSSANATGIPSTINKFGLYIKSVIVGQGAALGIDTTGVRLFIRGMAGSVWTSWKELQVRHVNDDTITTDKTSADMNTAYPVDTYPVGQEVMATNNNKIYKRKSSTVWVSWSITTV